MQGRKNHCIAVIGDGAITGGMAYEAMNHAGFLDKNMIVILNDNQQVWCHVASKLCYSVNRTPPTVCNTAMRRQMQSCGLHCVNKSQSVDARFASNAAALIKSSSYIHALVAL